MSSTTPWDIYAEQLLPHGYGHPLWMPEPNEREVLIGDVGWLRDGEFRALFNSRISGDEPINQLKGVPNDFKTFNPPNLAINRNNKIAQNVICSKSLRTVDLQAEAAASAQVAPVSAGAGFKFQSLSDSGAFVMLEPPTDNEDIESKRHIVNYMRENFDKWLEFANGTYSWGLDLKEQDILFICGTAKTTRWAVSAFQGDMFRQKQGYVRGEFGPVASAAFSINIENHVLPSSHWRHGPRQAFGSATPMLQHPDHPSPSGPRQANQCLFVHYYKMKRRLWWPRLIQAAAGPHQLPPGPDNPGADYAQMAGGGTPPYEFEAEGAPGRGETYDPVNVLLDYILENSDAQVAIASDLDLVAIFMDRDFPTDIHAGLEDARPVVEVDEDGVGTVAVDHRLMRKRRIDEEEVESGQMSKRVRASGSADPSGSAMDTDKPYYGLPQTDWDNASRAPPPPHSVYGDVHRAARQSWADDVDDDFDHEEGPTIDEDVPMEAAGERAAGKRPEWGAPTSTHDGSVTALAYSAEGQYVASGSEDTTVILWDAEVNQAIATLQGHGDTVSALAFSRDSKVLASASHDNDVILWSVDTRNELQRLQTQSAIHALAYTPDGTKLVAGGSDGRLQIYRIGETYEEAMVLEKNQAVVTFIIFSPDGRLMATGGTERVVYIWESARLDSESGRPEPLSVLEGHTGMVCAAAFSPDGRRIVTASDDVSSRIWRTETGELLVELHEHTGPVWTVAFSSDGRQVASGSSDGTVKVCDSFTGARVHSLDGHDSMINAVAFDPVGRYVASASSDNTVKLWDRADGKLVRTYNEHNDNVVLVGFAPDGTTLASASQDGTVLMRPLGSGAPAYDESDE